MKRLKHKETVFGKGREETKLYDLEMYRWYGLLSGMKDNDLVF